MIHTNPPAGVYAKYTPWNSFDVWLHHSVCIYIYIYIYIYVIYKPWQLGVYNKYTTRVRGSLPLINPKPEGRGVYQWQTSDDRRQGSYVCCIP